MRENGDAINHSIIAKQHQGGITTSIYLPNLAWIVCKYEICEIRAKYMMHFRYFAQKWQHRNFNNAILKTSSSKDIILLILYRMIIDRILKQTSNIQTKFAKDKHWVDISLQSRSFLPYRYLCSCSKWTRRKSCFRETILRQRQGEWKPSPKQEPLEARNYNRRVCLR